jgi:hypothetical protein
LEANVPLITVNCSYEYYPPDVPGVSQSEKHGATLAIARALPVFVSRAVNKVDSERGLPALTSEDVLVNFGQLHCLAIGASDMQILVMPGVGHSNASPITQATRRARIRDLIYEGLKDLIEKGNDSELFPWPAFDIEIIPMSMSGLAVSPQGEIEKRWGDPRME